MNNVVYLAPFSHRHKNGNTYTVEGELWVEPALNFDKHSADSDWDTQDYFEVVSLTVVDQSGNIVDTLEAEDLTLNDDKYWLKVLVRELEIQNEFSEEEGFQWGEECYEE